MKTSALVASIAALAVACSHAPSADDGTATADLAGVSPGKLRGTGAVSKTIGTRLFADPTSVDATHAIFDVKNVGGRAMAQASGTLAEGTATPISVSLWYAYASHVGDAFATVCSAAADGVSRDEARFTKYTAATSAPAVWALRPTVAAAIRDVCTYSGDRAESAGAYFDAVMGPGSSMANERTAFITAFATDASTAEERVRAMTIALVMNPYFVLER